MLELLAVVILGLLGLALTRGRTTHDFNVMTAEVKKSATAEREAKDITKAKAKKSKKRRMIPQDKRPVDFTLRNAESHGSRVMWCGRWWTVYDYLPPLPSPEED